ncbi:T9SS type A sorting domain-containing protein [Chryseobacterium phocaeense]|uniref:T9SS type A sorting domain-containing protein n=1 Tax=Chryseobacterium phocaeense TaxID=1816690 RepID=UPI0009BA982B|nr:T9SS type A sorting domain-containing protein [Chryseobacterium phocaeense]
MKKTLLLGLILIIQNVSAQVISKDLTFASNGIFSIGNDDAWSKMIQNSDGSIYFTHNESNSTTGLTDSFLSKLTPYGTLDNSFGTNGKYQLPYYTDESQIKKQADGKFLVIGFHSDDPANINYTDVTRFLANGQIDNSFGSNGTVSLTNLGADINLRGYGLLFQNNKVIVYGESITGSTFNQYRTIYRLNENGSIDTSFGNNGSQTTQGKFIFVDNQSNIISLNPSTDANPNVGQIEKYNSNGLPISGFGNNGVLVLSFSPGFIGAAYMDSNNNIIYSNINAEIGRIIPDGTLDPTFTFDPALLPFSTWISSIIEKNGNYYIGGMAEGANPGYFVSRLTQNGAIDPVFNYFVETDANLTEIGDMIVNDNNIIANGSGYIVKYLLNPANLATADIVKTNSDISFENPVNEDLVYRTQEKINKIEIYSADGKLVKTIKGNHTNVSELLKGVYTAKTTFENGKTMIKKLIKK